MTASHSRPGLDACLLYVMTLWLFAELAAGAQDAHHTEAVCCATNPSAEPPNSCGMCSSGNCCEDKWCTRCRSLPECPEGEELYCSGTTDFKYSCKPCPDGTFSDTKSGCCTPWTDCKKLGFSVIRSGNRTYNVQCGQDPVILVNLIQTDSSFVTFLIILTAAGIFLLVFLTFLLIICTWTQKKEKFPLEEEGEPVNMPDSIGSQLLCADAYSYQFPEEEHGDKMAEEKASLKP